MLLGWFLSSFLLFLYATCKCAIHMYFHVHVYLEHSKVSSIGVFLFHGTLIEGVSLQCTCTYKSIYSVIHSLQYSSVLSRVPQPLPDFVDMALQGSPATCSTVEYSHRCTYMYMYHVHVDTVSTCTSTTLYMNMYEAQLAPKSCCLVYTLLSVYIYIYMYTANQLSASIAQLVEHLSRTQTVVGSSPTQGSYYSLKMTVLGELHCVVLY